MTWTDAHAGHEAAPASGEGTAELPVTGVRTKGTHGDVDRETVGESGWMAEVIACDKWGGTCDVVREQRAVIAGCLGAGVTW